MTNIDAKTPQLTVVKGILEGYRTLNPVKNVLPLLAKDFKGQNFPESPELPDETGEEHVKKWGKILSLYAKLEVIAHEVIEAPGKVVTQIAFTGTGLDGTVLPYDTVFIYTLGEEDGELKALGYKDFADPEKREKLYSWAAKGLAKLSQAP